MAGLFDPPELFRLEGVGIVLQICSCTKPNRSEPTSVCVITQNLPPYLKHCTLKLRESTGCNVAFAHTDELETIVDELFDAILAINPTCAVSLDVDVSPTVNLTLPVQRQWYHIIITPSHRYHDHRELPLRLGSTRRLSIRKGLHTVQSTYQLQFISWQDLLEVAFSKFPRIVLPSCPKLQLLTLDPSDLKRCSSQAFPSSCRVELPEGRSRHSHGSLENVSILMDSDWIAKTRQLPETALQLALARGMSLPLVEACRVKTSLPTVTPDLFPNLSAVIATDHGLDHPRSPPPNCPITYLRQPRCGTDLDVQLPQQLLQYPNLQVFEAYNKTMLEYRTHPAVTYQTLHPLSLLRNRVLQPLAMDLIVTLQALDVDLPASGLASRLVEALFQHLASLETVAMRGQVLRSPSSGWTIWQDQIDYLDPSQECLDP
jgi:hypothetical protein